MRIRFPLACLLILNACTDAECSKNTSFLTGQDARVTCHSGGKVIFDGCSTGKILSEHGSDGYYFRDRETQRLVEVTGECFIDYQAPCPIIEVRPVKASND